MPDLILISWRDIPAQIVVKSGRQAVKRELSARFQHAIDSAAMQSGARDTDAYLADWQRAAPVAIDGIAEAIAETELARLEAAYDAARLRALIGNGGREKRDASVAFAPSGKRGDFPLGTDLLTVARALGVDLDSVCGGRGICGRCAVDPSFGAHAKLGIAMGPDSLSPVGDAERRYATKRGLVVGRRLACQTRLCGDAALDVPPESQLHRQIVRKSADERPVAIDPAVRLHYVEVAEPDMHVPASDARRVCEALANQWGIAGAVFSLAVLRELQATLRKGAWRATVALRLGREIVAIYPGFVERAYGLAVDIGSTTIAAHLCDLATGEVVATAGTMNPQIKLGEDLMSRVSYGMMNPGGAAELSRLAQAGVDRLAGEVASAAGIQRSAIVEAVCVGNPVMHHLYLGLDPVELGGAPFALTSDMPIDTNAASLGLSIAPGAYVHLPACVAGHVGADAAAVVLAETPQDAPGAVLVVDVGTNAELVLSAGGKLYACSSPTGPAFEGAQISAGQRAAPGAIERVRIDPQTLEPSFQVIGDTRWSNEPSYDPAPGVTGICGSGIVEIVAEMVLAGIAKPDGTIDGGLAARTPRVFADGRTFSYLLHDGPHRIAVTQGDIRAIQLAKGALYAGAKLLMAHAGIQTLDEIRLAGAFGAHLSPLHALVLGLVPDCEVEHVRAVGNAAGHGARIALLNLAARIGLSETVRRIDKIETALAPEFQALFVGAMAFPHASDPFDKLATRVALPKREPPGPPRRRRAVSTPDP
jgi:uncharacterized 2Fe-2S/4Fe-4S cluster protein (DUF4445 family)